MGLLVESYFTTQEGFVMKNLYLTLDCARLLKTMNGETFGTVFIVTAFKSREDKRNGRNSILLPIHLSHVESFIQADEFFSQTFMGIAYEKIKKQWEIHGYTVKDIYEDKQPSPSMFIYDASGFAYTGFNSHGYDREGYDLSGFNVQGWNRQGYDSNGYNVEGWDINGFDREGYDITGFDKQGFDRTGHDSEGYGRNGFNSAGYNRNLLDRDGFDHWGYTPEGYDRNGYDKDGYDRQGFDRNGLDKNGNSNAPSA